MHSEGTMQVSFWERMALVIGGGAIGMGLGVIFASNLGPTLGYWLILLGVVYHGWGMYTVGKHNQ